jgi:hypothetical protein
MTAQLLNYSPTSQLNQSFCLDFRGEYQQEVKALLIPQCLGQDELMTDISSKMFM